MTITNICLMEMVRRCLCLCNRQNDSTTPYLRYRREYKIVHIFKMQTHRHTDTKGVMRYGWIVMSHCRWVNTAFNINLLHIKWNLKRFAQEMLIDDGTRMNPEHTCLHRHCRKISIFVVTKFLWLLLLFFFFLLKDMAFYGTISINRMASTKQWNQKEAAAATTTRKRRKKIQAI